MDMTLEASPFNGSPVRTEYEHDAVVLAQDLEARMNDRIPGLTWKAYAVPETFAEMTNPIATTHTGRYEVHLYANDRGVGSVLVPGYFVSVKNPQIARAVDDVSRSYRAIDAGEAFSTLDML